MADVFVSYARRDRALVAPLVAEIEARGRSVWWDPAITPGQEFDRLIAAELASAAAVLVVWTKDSVDSRWVRGEARDAADRGILVPARFGEAQLPIDFRALHTIDLDRWADEPGRGRLHDVLEAIDRIVDAGIAPPATPRTGVASLGSRSGADRVAICVLPFANMSGDAEQEYFSDGITEDIITDLSKVSALDVSSRNSAFAYKGRHVDVKKAARDLGVSHVLEGSVRKAGGRVRITAQLVDAATNNHLWAERYDRDLNDIFSLQDEISRAIVAALRLRLLPEEKSALGRRGTDDVEAYNLYLMAWQRYISGPESNAQSLDSIVRLCRRATEIDARYARAWALLAVAQMMLRFSHGRTEDDGLAAAEQALALDPDLAEAHSAKARILARHGRYDEAFAEFDIALRLDPESWDVNRWIGYWKLAQGRPAEAIRYYEKAVSLADADLWSAAMLQSCYAATGDPDNLARVAQLTLQRADDALDRDPSGVQALCYGALSHAALGHAAEARQWMDRALVADPDNRTTRYNFGCSLARLGQIEAAVDMLYPVFASMDAAMFRFTQADPDLAALRGTERFEAMVAATMARLREVPDGHDEVLAHGAPH